MNPQNSYWIPIEDLINEIIRLQQKKLLSLAKQVVPQLTEDDLLQPNDFPELENHPVFRYEEGILTGIQTVQMALRALKREEKRHE